ncbi:hypothetical protein DXD52_09475, partial [Bifidobacterium longum]
NTAEPVEQTLKQNSTTSTFYAFATLDMMRKAVDAANPGPDPSKETWLSEQRLRQLHTLK